MAEKVTEISLVYNDPEIENCPDNLLTFRIQPNESISLNLQAKKPGLSNETQDITMDYIYSRSKDDITHGAYEKLLIDAMDGDQKLFPSTEEVLESWRIVDKVVEQWSKNSDDLDIYKPGSWSTPGATKLLADNNHKWLISDPKEKDK